MKYFLDCDDDGHWYLVQANRRGDWTYWLNLNSEDERSWTPPDFVKPLNRHVSYVEFENPESWDKVDLGK